MAKFYIEGGNKLYGEVSVLSAKNSLLPILSACILVDGKVVIKGFVKYADCLIMLKILKNLGAEYKICKNDLYLDCTKINDWTIESDLGHKLRSSFFCLGALLGRFGEAKVAYPGGCNIGTRPVDMHINGLKDLGYKIVDLHGYVYGFKQSVFYKEVTLPFPSVGATENLIMASVCLNQTTTIRNCAREPEIEDLISFLNKCGAIITGGGTDVLIVKGVGKLLSGTTHKCIGDRIIAGTYAIMCACTGGNIKLKNIDTKYMQSVILKLKQSGVYINEEKNALNIISNGELKSINKIITKPYPDFPTDLQSQILVMQTISKGSSIIKETIFENRFKNVSELLKMGAEIKIKNNEAFIKGVNCLFGADLYAFDLRSGASLIIASLVAKGYSNLYNIELIDRGYYKIENDLTSLGAIIKRIK